jgi:glycosyltransferase involved in cell wall biosynthesis
MLRSAYDFFYWHSARSTLSRVVASNRPDAVIGYWAHPDGAAAVRLARLLGVPSAIIVGGSDILVVTANGRRRRRIASVLQSADAIITLSRDLRTKILDLGVGVERVHLWERGVDACFVPGDRTEARRRLGVDLVGKLLVWVGRLVPVKGLETLFSACQIALERGEHFRVHLVGDGPLRRRLEADRDARGLREMIVFEGTRDHDHLPDWFRAADLTVLPSWSEGLPNVLRESRACNTPFVASRVGGIPEIAGRSDRLFEPGDALALADAICESLSELACRPDRVEPGRPLSWSESAAALVDILRPLMPEARAVLGRKRHVACEVGGAP